MGDFYPPATGRTHVLCLKNQLFSWTSRMYVDVVPRSKSKTSKDYVPCAHNGTGKNTIQLTQSTNSLIACPPSFIETKIYIMTYRNQVLCPQQSGQHEYTILTLNLIYVAIPNLTNAINGIKQDLLATRSAHMALIDLIYSPKSCNSYLTKTTVLPKIQLHTYARRKIKVRCPLC